MSFDDSDQRLFRELRRRWVPPPIDVAQRVLTTIQEGPSLRGSLSRWTMAVCAALCGVAACLALTAAVAQRFANQTDHAGELVINTYDVEVQSLLR
jgi:hypothetical protein